MKYKGVFSVILFSFVGHIVFAQSSWKTEDYQKITINNFRNDLRFQQKYDTSAFDYRLLNAVLFYVTNEQRKNNNIEIIPYSKECEIAAYHHSKQMVLQDFFSHWNPKDPARENKNLRAKLAGIKNPYIAENIAYVWAKSGESYLELGERIVDNWMDSKGHRENILSDKTIVFACGVYFGGGKIYATQVFQWFEAIVPSAPKDKLPK